MAEIVKRGQTFSITLEENPTTGYAWVFKIDRGLSLVYDVYKPYNTMTIGAGGHHEYIFRADSLGLKHITGYLKRSWERGEKEAYNLNVMVI